MSFNDKGKCHDIGNKARTNSASGKVRGPWNDTKGMPDTTGASTPHEPKNAGKPEEGTVGKKTIV